MGREVRRVPANWQHPQCTRFAYNENGFQRVFIPLMNFSTLRESIDDMKGAMAAHKIGRMTMDQKLTLLNSLTPKGDYMPNWSPEEATHYMMYENTSEGTPISAPSSR